MKKVKFEKLPNNLNGLYDSIYTVKYKSKFDLGEFKIYNRGFGSKSWIIEVDGSRIDFEFLMEGMGYTYPTYRMKSLFRCKIIINEIITHLSKLSYWVTK